jgi:hypothetical protein
LPDWEKIKRLLKFGAMSLPAGDSSFRTAESGNFQVEKR